MKRLLLGLTTFALVAPANAFARGTFDPTTEFEQHEWIPIHLGPLNLSITKAVVYLLLATVLTILVGLVLMRGKTLNRRQTVGEQIYEVAQVQIAEQGLPSKAMGRWFPRGSVDSISSTATLSWSFASPRFSKRISSSEKTPRVSGIT